MWNSNSLLFMGKIFSLVISPNCGSLWLGVWFVSLARYEYKIISLPFSSKCSMLSFYLFLWGSVHPAFRCLFKRIIPQMQICCVHWRRWVQSSGFALYYCLEPSTLYVVCLSLFLSHGKFIYEMAGWHHRLNGHEFWVNSRSWWWTGRPGVLWFMGSQRVRHEWVTELNWTEVHITLKSPTVYN